MNDANTRPKKIIALFSILLLIGVGVGWRLIQEDSGDCPKQRKVATEAEFKVRDNLQTLVVISTFRWLDSSTRASVKTNVLATAGRYSSQDAGIVFSDTEMKISNFFDVTLQFRDALTSSIFAGLLNATTPTGQQDLDFIERFANEARSVAAGSGKCLPEHMFDRKNYSF
jgi:hypothetical protein